MYNEKKFNDILVALSSFKTIIKYDRITPFILLHGKSAYIEGSEIKAKIDFMDVEFEQLTSIPFGKTFEHSENPRDPLLALEINKINKLARSYCDTLFFICKNDVIDFMDYNYNSMAKLNKIDSTFISCLEPMINFTPSKKSTSVHESEYIIDTTKRIHPNFRISDASITIRAVLLYHALKNQLLTETVKMEINERLGFARISCVNDDIRAKFMILGKKMT